MFNMYGAYKLSIAPALPPMTEVIWIPQIKISWKHLRTCNIPPTLEATNDPHKYITQAVYSSQQS